MKSNKTVIMVIPRNGTGKIHAFRVSPVILRLFFFIVLICVVSVPLLEIGIFSVTDNLETAQQNQRQLYADILTLQYVKKSLIAIEENDAMLRNYFGLEKYTALEPIMIGGGELNLEISADEDIRNNSKRLSSNQPVRHFASLPSKLRTFRSNHAILNGLIIKQDEARKNTPSIIPVDSKKRRITSGFGWRKNPFTSWREFHSGIDIIGPEGTKIIAPADGIVITTGHDRWLGNYVVLQHTKTMKTIYGHLHRVTVKEGLRVKRGDSLGFMGNTGMSTSRHLHYTILENGRVVNPMQYILNMRG